MSSICIFFFETFFYELLLFRSHIYELVLNRTSEEFIYNLKVNVSFEVAGEHFCSLVHNDCDESAQQTSTLRVFGEFPSTIYFVLHEK